MKLSQKLLALSGVAVADYACCAYDDYGIPSECGLSEKTPFAAGDWRDNQCKAWEANVDASFDGNDNGCSDNENWSSCGFQRHFPWQAPNPAVDLGYTDNGFGEAALVFGSGASALTFNTGSGGDKYTIGGAPFLGGVCKLWMPVALDNVLSVSIAGVHLSGSGTHRGDGTYNGVPGSLHCFSVVNPSEFLSNDDNIHNGNVAGWRTDGVVTAGDGMQSDIFSDGNGGFVSETDRQQGIGHQWYYNSRAGEQRAFGLGDATRDFDGDSNVGPNFDVVAHFKHSFCITKWTKEEMQMVGDWGSNGTPGSEDYPLGGGVDDNHAHTDTADKRFADDLRQGDNQSGNDLRNDKYACVDADCDNTAGMNIKGGNGEIYRWPNAGAFAGFYSFVACANVDPVTDEYNLVNAYKYIFHASGAGACASTQGSTASDNQSCMIPRAVVVSLANDDFRVEDCLTAPATRTLTARWNVRQAGTNIRNCGPGTLPDGDGGRCSWNWNFNPFNANSVLQDEAEAFFERSSPRDFQPWSATTGAVGRWVQEGSPDSPVSDVVITSEYLDSDTPAAALVGTISLDIPAKYVTVTEELDADTAGKHVFTLGCVNTVDGSRDTFPDCYQGEEIHYEWTSAANAASEKRLDPWATKVSATF